MTLAHGIWGCASDEAVDAERRRALAMVRDEQADRYRAMDDAADLRAVQRQEAIDDARWADR